MRKVEGANVPGTSEWERQWRGHAPFTSSLTHFAARISRCQW